MLCWWASDKFSAAFSAFPAEKGADKLITSAYLGISSGVAREIVYRACGRFDASVSEVSCDKLYSSFSLVFDAISKGEFTPTVILDGGAPIEYSFIDLGCYGSEFEHRSFDSASDALDLYFASRDREQRVRQRAADILGLLTNAENRLIKKIDVQEKELAD